MPIVYNVIPNYLTVPPSYTCRPTPNQIMGYDDVAAAINVRNPTIPVATAKSVLEAFRTEAVSQLSEGNSINLAGFMSLVVSMPVKLDVPTDSLPIDPIDIKAKPSAPFKTEVRQAASYSRGEYIEKQPNILNARDTNLAIDNYVRSGFGFAVVGSNLSFNANPGSGEGVFITDADGLEVLQENISLADPSKVIITPTFGASAVEPWQVEKTLTVKARYTTNGQIRTGNYSKKLRSINVIDSVTNVNLFAVGDAASGPATVTEFAADDVDARIQAVIQPDNSLTLAVGYLDDDMGSPVTVPQEDGAEVVLTGLDEDLTVTVDDYLTLFTSLNSYGRFMQEIVNLNTVSPT